jgi:hypothetical protein
MGSVFYNMSLASTTGAIVNVYVDGELYDTGFLEENKTIEVVTKYGENDILIKDGEVSISSADCRDQLCVRMNGISHSDEHIVCLPHHLHIEIENDNQGEVEIDAISQ